MVQKGLKMEKIMNKKNILLIVALGATSASMHGIFLNKLKNLSLLKKIGLGIGSTVFGGSGTYTAGFYNYQKNTKNTIENTWDKMLETDESLSYINESKCIKKLNFLTKEGKKINPFNLEMLHSHFQKKSGNKKPSIYDKLFYLKIPVIHSQTPYIPHYLFPDLFFIEKSNNRFAVGFNTSPAFGTFSYLHILLLGKN